MNLDLQPGRLLAGANAEYRLGKLMAEGGEGGVYQIQDREDVAAKIFKSWDPDHERKLTHLIRLGTKRLYQIAAWPLSRLSDEQDATVGFVMERLEGWQPLHTVYQIRARLKYAPNRHYGYLVRTARNLAAAVHHVHDAGLVIGDLNESNVFVGSDAMVKLIDVDSFQVCVGEERHFCKVGKLELLAPELQGHSLERLQRTPNHDCFALAVLLFQLLVFGRHPFAGRPKTDDEVPLELAIANGWYAFSTRRSVPLDPPPFLDVSWLPEKVREMFEDAFDPAAERRPTAQEWFDALKDLESGLTGCPTNGGHTFPKEAKTCPWCDLEEHWNIPLFMPTLADPNAGEPSMNLDSLWRSICSIPVPMAGARPEMPDWKDIVPEQVPGWMRFIAFPGVSFVYPLLYFAFFFSRETFGRTFVILVAVFIFLLVWALASAIFLARLRVPVEKSRKALERLRERWEKEADPARFTQKVQELAEYRDKLANGEGRLKQLREEWIRTSHQEQLIAFLEKYSVLAADAGPIGTSKLAYLQDRGFRTAADITEARVKRIRDHDDEFWKDLLRWRQTLEDQFWKTTQFSLSPVQERQLIVRIQKENAEMREEMKRAENELLALRETLARQQQEIAEIAAPHLEVIHRLAPRLVALDAKQESR